MKCPYCGRSTIEMWTMNTVITLECALPECDFVNEWDYSTELGE